MSEVLSILAFYRQRPGVGGIKNEEFPGLWKATQLTNGLRTPDMPK